MGRRKRYDRDEVLEKAMRLFWDRGFHATSTRDLTDAMGINVYSLYAEFDSKEALYEAAIQRYDRGVVTGHFGRLEGEDAGLADIQGVLRFFGSAAREENPMLGCLITNTITELAPNPDAGREAGISYVDRLRSAFRHALERSVAAGELTDCTPIESLASFLAVTLLGVFVMLRAGDDWQIMRDTTEQALARVESFRP